MLQKHMYKNIYIHIYTRKTRFSGPRKSIEFGIDFGSFLEGVFERFLKWFWRGVWTDFGVLFEKIFDTKSMPNRCWIYAKSIPNQCQIDAASMPNRCHINTKSMLNQCQIDVWMMLDRCLNDAGLISEWCSIDVWMMLNWWRCMNNTFI